MWISASQKFTKFMLNWNSQGDILVILIYYQDTGQTSSKGVQHSETTDKLKVPTKKRDEGESIHNDVSEEGDTDIFERE